MINENLMESGGGKAIIDPAEAAGAVGDGRTAAVAAPGDGAAQTEEEKAAATAAAEAAEAARVSALTPEQKQAEQDAKIAEDNKDKTPEEIAALQAAARDTRSPEEIKAEAYKAAKDAADLRDKQIADAARNELFKKYGVKSEAELAAKLNPVVETPEQKQQKQELYTATLNKYAVENGVFSNDELSTLDALKKMPAEDLVYNQFKKDFTEANKDRVDADNKARPVTEDEIRDSFNELYHLESDNKALQDIGKKNLALAAKSIIEPLEGKYNDVKEVFDEENRKTAALPSYAKFVKSVLADSVPKELVFGEGDNKATIVLNNLDLAALERHFVKNHYFEDFLENGGTDEQRAEFEREIKKEIYFQNIDAITKVVGDVREGVGMKKAVVGAKQPFEDPKGPKPVAVVTKDLTPEEQGSLKKAFA
jgi:hypothetical protein